MPRQNVSLQTFNRGKISPRALARVDLTRTRLSAEQQENYVPRVLGSMMLRPGWEYLDTTRLNMQAFHIPFIAAVDDMAVLEMTDTNMRVRIDDELVTRVAVSTAFTNGDFSIDLTGWTDADQSGATSTWATGGYMSLVGTVYNKAIRQQTLTVGAADQGDEHAVRVTIARGVVTIRIGSTSGDDDYLSETTLYPGTHSLTFTPTGGSAFVELASTTQYASLVDSISIESAGALTLPTIWTESDLQNLRYTQSVDVLFVACKGKRQQKIERHNNTRSWSVVDYIVDDGPFLTENLTNVTLSAAALTGDTTLTASQKYFKPSNVGSLFRITSIGQQVSATLNGANQFTSSIKVIGTGSSRNFTIAISGTWSGTLTVQRSVSVLGADADTSTTFTGNTAGTIFNDGLDNEIVYYRIGFKTGNYTSGSAVITLTYSSGGLTGVARVISYVDATSVNVSIVTPMGSTTGSTNWSEGAWSPRRGYPSAVALYEGRLWWAGKSKIWGSISDAYSSFDDQEEGDSGPISRSIGAGPLDNINWLLTLQRLILGAQSQEISVRSSSFDEVLTPSNFNMKIAGTQGSHNVAAEIMDNGGIFVQEGGTRVFQLAYDPNIYDYSPAELTTLVPEQCLAGIKRIVIQRKPDTRLHCIMEDGTVSLLVFDKTEDVICWVDITTDGEIEDVVVLPDAPEDRVYYTVKRTIGGSEVRYYEKWAIESECQGGAANKQADSFVYYSGTPTTTITGLSHLEGEEVVVWADGMDVGTATVSGGQITLATAASEVVVGLYYRARFKSAKLAYAAAGGTALNMRKRVCAMGGILLNTHRFGIKFGGDFDHLDDLPGVEDGSDVDDDYIWSEYDKTMIPFNGEWDTDSRLCLESEAPKPANILALTLTIETNG